MLSTDTFQITPEVLRLIARIDEFKGAWRALGTLAPDRLSVLCRVATIESIGSSTRIEGSNLSDRDVEKLRSNLAIQTFETRDEQEVAGYAELMDLVFSSWQAFPLTKTISNSSTRCCFGIATRTNAIGGSTKPIPTA